MAPQSKDAALRKRQLINAASRKMFMWVAIASVIVGFSAVVSLFLFQKIMYKEKVLAAKYSTISVLDKDNTAAPELTNNVRVLETNSALNSIKANSQDKALQVVLDALPASENVFALGASVQSKLIGGAEGVQLESFSVDQSNVGQAITTTGSAKPIMFSATVSSDSATALYGVLNRLERSIRTIDIDSLMIEKSDTKMTMTIQGHAFYLDAKQIKLENKVVSAK